MKFFKKAFLLICILSLLCSCTKTEKLSGEQALDQPVEETESAVLQLQSRRPDTYNPLLTEYKSVRDIYDLIYDSLVNIDEAFRAVPNLASDWSYSDNNRILTINLKENIKWHDGAPFSAADVLYTVEFLKKNPCSFSSLVENVDSVSQTGPHTVIFALASPDGGFVDKLTFPIIKKDFSTLPDTPTGTGQYLFDSVINSNELKLIANRSYHLGTPVIKELVVRFCSTDYKAISSYESGEIDILSDNVDLSKISSKQNSRIITYPDNKYIFIGLNHNREIFKNETVRRCLSAAIDRSAICRASVIDSLIPANAPVHSLSYLYCADLDKLTYDKDYAASLLSGDGWVKNTSLNTLEKDGTGLSFELICPDDDTSRQTSAALVASQLLSVGISVHVSILDKEAFNARLSSGNFDAVIAESSVSSFRNFDYLLGTDGGANKFGYSSAVMDLRLSSLRMAETDESTIDEMRKFMRYFSENQPIIGLYFKNGSVLHRTYVDTINIKSSRIYKDLYSFNIIKKNN